MDEAGNPTLNNRGTIDGLKFIKRLRDLEKIIPNEADYNVADILFKDGNAGMIINGDWSWAGYQNAGLDIGVAPLPQISSTGLWCAPMVSPKGFSLNANISDEKKALAWVDPFPHVGMQMERHGALHDADSRWRTTKRLRAAGKIA
jgi:maltose-binding protein MalE